jgi:pyridoxine 5-phosphate synthase
MIRLGVNVDHVATVRNARGTSYPHPVQAAALAEMAGADNITIHLREDRRHIRDRDLEVIRDAISIPLNLEMAATAEMVKIALSVKPRSVTLVPEKREELTTEGGLNIAGHRKHLETVISQLSDAGLRVVLFVEPTREAIAASKDVGAHAVELHTGNYCVRIDETAEEAVKWRLTDELSSASKVAGELGLACHLGHGLHYQNANWLQAVALAEEANIGHAIVGRAVMVGMAQAVREMKALLNDPAFAPRRITSN